MKALGGWEPLGKHHTTSFLQLARTPGQAEGALDSNMKKATI